MDELSKRRKWRRWLSVIQTEVEALRRQQQVYHQVLERVDDQPDLRQWVEQCYLITVSLAIRRLTDTHPRYRTLSLLKLLDDMRKHSDCLSRRAALMGLGVNERNEVNRLFDTIAGRGSMHIPATVIQMWAEEFRCLAEPFRAWVDHRIAHHDYHVDAKAPAVQQAVQVLNWLSDLTRKLCTLLPR